MTQKARFTRIAPNEVRSLAPEARYFLEKTAREAEFAELSAIDVLEGAAAGDGLLYTVTLNAKVTGVVYFMANEDVLNIAHLGGEKLMQWKRELYDFVVQVMREHGYRKLWVISRDGWGRLYPEMKPIGTLFEFTPFD